MAFSIGFTPELLLEASSRVGVLMLGGYSESFLASLEHWSEARYQEQWRAALERVVAGEERSCLITSIRPPELCAGVAWWPLYRRGDVVYVQNAILFFHTLAAPFDERNPHLSVPDRTTVSRYGELLSEWEVPVREIQEFLRAWPVRSYDC